MEFRWVALITLWTFLVAPILGAPSGPPQKGAPPAQTRVNKTTPPTRPAR